MGDVSSYYVRMLTNIDLYKGQTIGISIIFAWLALFTMIYLFVLAILIIRARPSAAVNRFMSIMLITEGFKVMTSWNMLYPFGPGIMPLVQYIRLIWYFFSILSLMLYLSTSSFYPVRFLRFMNKDVIRNNLYWSLPLFSALIVTWLIVNTGGIVEAFGGLVFVSCTEASANCVPELSLYPGTKEIIASCGLYSEYHPYQFFVPEQTGLARLLLLAPVFFALIALAFMRNAQRGLEKSDTENEKATEARALFIGFFGKVVFQGSMVAFMIYITIKFGQFNVVDIARYLGKPELGFYLIFFYGFLFSILATALFEGVMFTYAILKNEILGIDERLRKTFSTAVFAGTGGILFLIASEVMESMIGIGWIGGVLIGLPIIMLRKPILSGINRFSNIIMPESLTSGEKNYLEAYALAREDDTITDRERQLLELQAKTLGLEPSRVLHLEAWFDSNLNTEEGE